MLKKTDVRDLFLFAFGIWFIAFTPEWAINFDRVYGKYLYIVGILITIYFAVLFIMGMGYMQGHDRKNKDED